MADRVEGEIVLDTRQVQEAAGWFGAAMGKVDAAAQKTSNKLDNELRISFTNLGNSARNVDLSGLLNQLNLLSSRDFFGGIAKGGASALSSIITTGAGFQQEINKVQTIAKLDPSKLEEFAESLRTVGRELNLAVTPVQAAQSAYQVLSSNFTKAADAEKVLRTSLQLSKAGNADQAAATKLLAGTLNAYSLSAEQAAVVGSKLFQTVNLGTVEIPELAEGLGRVTSAAAGAGVSLDELLAVIAAGTTKGVPFSTAVDGMGGVISALQKPTARASAEFAALGVKIDASTLKADGFERTILKLQTALKQRGNDSSLANIFEDRAARNLATGILGDVSLFQQDVQAIKGSVNDLKSAVDTTSAGAAEAAGRFKASFETLATGLEQQVDPALSTVINAGTDLLNLFDSIPGPVKTVGLVLTGAATAAAGLGFAAFGTAAALVAMNAQLVAAGINLPLMVAKQVTAIALTTQLGFATGGVSGAFQALAGTAAIQVAVLGGLGAAAIGLALAYKQVTDEVGKADDALARANDGIKQFRKVNEISRADALGLNAKQLADRGVTTDDLTQKIQDTIKRGEETDNATIKAKFQKEAAELKKRRAELFEELKKREAEKEKPVEKLERFDPKADKNAKKAADQADRDRKKKEREEKAEQKRQFDEKFKQDLQDVDNSKGTTEQKIAQLKRLLGVYKDHGDQRRQIEDKLRQHEEQLQKQREDDVAKLAKLRENAVDAEIARSQQRQNELDKLRERGVDTSGAENAELDKRAGLDKKKIQTQLEQDLAKESNPAIRAEMKRQAEAAKKDVDTATTSAKDDVRQGRRETTLENDLEGIDAAKASKDFKIKLIQEQLAAGKNYESQLRQAAQERLDLEEQEAQKRVELVKAQTDDPRKIAAAEEEAQQRILEARRRANAEVEAGTRALREQKKAKDSLSSKEFSGRFQSIDEFLNDNHQFFGDGSEPEKKAKPGRPLVPAFKTREIEEKILNSAGSPRQAAEARAQMDVSGHFVVELEYPDGTRKPATLKEVTLDGRGSRTERAARTMSTSTGLGGV